MYLKLQLNRCLKKPSRRFSISRKLGLTHVWAIGLGLRFANGSLANRQRRRRRLAREEFGRYEF